MRKTISYICLLFFCAMSCLCPAFAGMKSNTSPFSANDYQRVALTDLSALENSPDTNGAESGTKGTVLQGNASRTVDISQVEATSNSEEARATALPIYEWYCKSVHPKAAVILVHGLFQHGESLAPIGKHLASIGYLAISIDQRGHGFWHFKNGSREPGYSIDYQQTIEDVKTVARLLREEHPYLPIFCLGESAGAAIAARAAVEGPGLFDGLILCAFATKPRALRLVWTIEDVAVNMFDWDRDIQMTRYLRRFTSEDKRTTLETMNDPMCRKGISLKELLGTVRFMKKTSHVAKHLSPNMPLLMVEGEDDQVLSPKSSAKFLAHSRCLFKSLVLIPHCGHVLVSTNYIKPQVLTSIDQWLNTHASGQFSTSAVVAAK
ncbi:MAG TPA: alpha/beta fold hydrolase [Oculatellaceae cyanobacterium]